MLPRKSGSWLPIPATLQGRYRWGRGWRPSRVRNDQAEPIEGRRVWPNAHAYWPLCPAPPPFLILLLFHALDSLWNKDEWWFFFGRYFKTIPLIDIVKILNLSPTNFDVWCIATYKFETWDIINIWSRHSVLMSYWCILACHAQAVSLDVICS